MASAEPIHSKRTRWFALGAVVASFAFSCALITARGVVPFSSDQAVSALMALDIQERGEHPVFYLGVEYAGSFEPHVLSVVFRVLPANETTYRATMAALLLVGILAVWRATDRFFGPRAALVAGLYLAFGPSYLFSKGLTSDGAYVSLFLFSALAMLFLAETERAFENARAAWLPIACLGGSLGVGWWVLPVSACFAPPVAGVALFSRQRRRWFAPSTVLVGLAGFFAGSLPWWVRNVRLGFPSLKAPELALAATSSFASKLGSLFVDGLSLVLGGRALWSVRPVFKGSFVLCALLFLACVVVAARGLRRSEPGLGRTGSQALLLLGLSALALSLSAQRTNFGDPRYLMPLYVFVAPLVGKLLDALERKPRGLALAGLAGLHLASHFPPRPASNLHSAAWVDAKPLVDALVSRGVTALYSGYDVAYRLTFLSGRRILGSPLDPSGRPVARHARLMKSVDAHPNPAFLVDRSEAGLYDLYLGRNRFAHRREEIGALTLYSDVAAEAFPPIRRCRCIPAAPNPAEFRWLVAEGPRTLKAGGRTTFSLRALNTYPAPFSRFVSASYHWKRPDGSVALFDGVRSPLPRQSPSETDPLVIPSVVAADVPPGEYDLVFDVVEDEVQWFEWRGIAPLVVRVRVLE